MEFSYLDIIIALPLLYGAYKGYSKGLIKEVAGIVALAVGIIVAKAYAPDLAPQVEAATAMQPQIATGVCFAGLFIAIVLVVNFIGSKLTQLLKMVALGFINRLFGLVFGVVKVLLIMGCVVYLLSTFQMADYLMTPELKANSILYPALERLVTDFFPLITKEAQPIMDHASDQIIL